MFAAAFTTEVILRVCLKLAFGDKENHFLG